jgi:anti-sigma regulatory factor (Ser/Thr protein kinase)
MTGIRARGEDVRRFILEHVEQHPTDIAKLAAEKFGVTRQAVNKHLQKLTAEGALAETGKTRSRAYKVRPSVSWSGVFRITSELAEDVVWEDAIKSALGPLPANVLNIWHYGFTEMFNNAIDHSGGTEILVEIRRTAISTQMLILDNGVGIFKKIQAAMGLLDERHAILELSKGKLTTDPKNHSGEGIFFTSRMFDSFDILSGGVYFTHTFGSAEDWILQRDEKLGTAVFMDLHNHTARTAKKIFDQFSSGDDYGFNKTIVPVSLARYGPDGLISRSQAKRLLARVELFKVVILDFEGVAEIGQAFADEIFRVFANHHPEIDLKFTNAGPGVTPMISRALAADGQDKPISPEPS